MPVRTTTITIRTTRSRAESRPRLLTMTIGGRCLRDSGSAGRCVTHELLLTGRAGHSVAVQPGVLLDAEAVCHTGDIVRDDALRAGGCNAL